MVSKEDLELFTKAEVGRMLRMGDTKLAALIKAEEMEAGTGIESMKIGKSRRFTKDHIARFIQKMDGQEWDEGIVPPLPSGYTAA